MVTVDVFGQIFVILYDVFFGLICSCNNYNSSLICYIRCLALQRSSVYVQLQFY